MSSAESAVATSRLNPLNDEPIAKTERVRLRFERALQFAFADDEDADARVALRRSPARRSTRY